MKFLMITVVLLLCPFVFWSQHRWSFSEALGRAWISPQTHLSHWRDTHQASLIFSLENVQATDYLRSQLAAFLPTKAGAWMPFIVYDGFKSYQTYGIGLMAARPFGPRLTVALGWQGLISRAREIKHMQFRLGVDVVMNYRIHPRCYIRMLMQAPIPLRKLKATEAWPFGRIELSIDYVAGDRIALSFALRQDIRDIPEAFLGVSVDLCPWLTLGCSLTSRAALQVAMSFQWNSQKNRQSAIGIACTERLSTRCAYTQSF